MVHFLLTLFPVCASEPDQPGSRKRRRKQVRGSFYALALPLCMGPGWYVLATASSSPEEFHGTQRRPLGTALQENTELLGFALGLLATFVAFTARIPLLSRVCRGRLSPATQLWASISSALASVLYAAAIVAPDQQPAYVMRALPWLLLSLGSAALDLTIACLSCMMKSQLSQQLGLVAEATETLDMRALLAQAVEEEEWEGSEEEKDWILPCPAPCTFRPPPTGAWPSCPRPGRDGRPCCSACALCCSEAAGDPWTPASCTGRT
uniref:Transmembrane protein 44 n=1 Tax=Pelusios castaneus TaxID=367368 RepID=A0A8C8S290_9SAUR